MGFLAELHHIVRVKVEGKTPFAHEEVRAGDRATTLNAVTSGYGVSVRDTVFEVTSANRDGGDRLNPTEVPYDKPTRSVYVGCGQQHEIPTLTIDMIRRACAVSDGNSFYGDYDPKNLSEDGMQNEVSDDLSLQYMNEARHTIMGLEGLNVVHGDLVVAAMLGETTRGNLQPGASAPPREDALKALTRVALRILGDTDGNAVMARENADDFVRMVAEGMKSALT